MKSIYSISPQYSILHCSQIPVLNVIWLAPCLCAHHCWLQSCSLSYSISQLQHFWIPGSWPKWKTGRGEVAVEFCCAWTGRDVCVALVFVLSARSAAAELSIYSTAGYIQFVLSDLVGVFFLPSTLPFQRMTRLQKTLRKMALRVKPVAQSNLIPEGWQIQKELTANFCCAVVASQPK